MACWPLLSCLSVLITLGVRYDEPGNHEDRVPVEEPCPREAHPTQEEVVVLCQISAGGVIYGFRKY